VPRNPYLLWRGAAVMAGVEHTAREAAQEFAEGVLEDANQHVPYELGNLEETGIAVSQQAHESGGRFSHGAEAIVSYDTPYAVHLHEHPEFNFQGKGEGKWLAKAIYRAMPNYERGLAPRFIRFFKAADPRLPVP